jgi:hypothetical protein
MVLTGGWFMALFYPHYELFHPQLLLHQGYRWHQPCLSFVRLLAIMRSSATTSERKKNFATSGQYPKKTWGKKKSVETWAVRAPVSYNPTSFQTRHCGNSLGAEPTNLAWKCPLSDLHPSSQRDPPLRPQKTGVVFPSQAGLCFKKQIITLNNIKSTKYLYVKKYTKHTFVLNYKSTKCLYKI